jgi:uncharacterized protein YjiS (DUF1127 family)
MTTKPLRAPALTSSAPTIACGTIITSIGRTLARYAKYRRWQRDYEQLLGMSERELRDIGLTRGGVMRMKSESMRLFSH